MDHFSQLSYKHKDFVKAYVENGYNATKAWLSVMPDSTYHTAATTASDLLKRPEVKAAIEEIKQPERAIRDIYLLQKLDQIRDYVNRIEQEVDDPVQKWKLLNDLLKHDSLVKGLQWKDEVEHSKPRININVNVIEGKDQNVIDIPFKELKEDDDDSNNQDDSSNDSGTVQNDRDGNSSTDSSTLDSE